MPVTVLTAKVLGTVTIGLWAGYNASLVQGSEKHASSLCALGSRLCWRRTGKSQSQSARAEEPFSPKTAFKALGRSVAISGMAGLALATNLVSYFSASRSGRHPYLLYLALGAPLVGLLQFYGARELTAQLKAADSDSESMAGEEPSELSESAYEHIPAARKDADSLEAKCGIFTGVVALLSSALYVISVIGLAGDPSA